MKVPDHSTPCLAEAKLAAEGGAIRRPAARLLRAGRRARAARRHARSRAVDSTGLETRHASAHFRRRVGRTERAHEAWPKLSAAVHCRSHLIAGVHVCRGPTQDSPQFTPVMRRQAARDVRIARVLADKAYDAEHNHVLCRREPGVRTTAIPVNPRAHPGRVPKTPYRRLMSTRGSRVGSTASGRRPRARFSRHKRLLGSSLTAEREDRQHNEIRMRVPTHNLMLLAGVA